MTTQSELWRRLATRLGIAVFTPFQLEIAGQQIAFTALITQLVVLLVSSPIPIGKSSNLTQMHSSMRGDGEDVGGRGGGKGRHANAPSRN